MKRALLLLVPFLLFLLPLRSFADRALVITPMETFDTRLKLRESPDGKVIGQYYSGTPCMVDKEQGKWSHVQICGRSGWMMTRYLTETPSLAGPPAGDIAFPDPDGCIELIDFTGQNHRIPVSASLRVLGTIGETFVHVAAEIHPGETLYGDCLMEKFSWTENHSHAVVRSDRPDLPVNVRESPSASSYSVAKLYPGVKVHLIFDWHTAEDGWHRVRIGPVSGFIRDDYLDFSTDAVQELTPCWGILNAPTAIVTGSMIGEVSRNDPLFILGTTGKSSAPLFFCEGKTWLDEQTYGSHFFYIQQRFVTPPQSGSLSLIATIHSPEGAVPLRLNPDSPPTPIEGANRIPAGSTLYILCGLDEEGHDLGWGPYLTADTTLCQCQLLSGDSLPVTDLILPLEDLTVEPGLFLPTDWTGG